ncbi:hypothetical protein EDB86DRAFT_2829131 [Lactarius hatsudake]|nr:hypothetical protein EDB86DRAFT_2829131 [Lactarius hatsudake]
MSSKYVHVLPVDTLSGDRNPSHVFYFTFGSSAVGTDGHQETNLLAPWSSSPRPPITLSISGITHISIDVVVVDLTQAISPQARACTRRFARTVSTKLTRDRQIPAASSADPGSDPFGTEAEALPRCSRLACPQLSASPGLRAESVTRITTGVVGLSTGLSDIGGSHWEVPLLPGPASSCRLAPSAFSRPRIEFLTEKALVLRKDSKDPELPGGSELRDAYYYVATRSHRGMSVAPFEGANDTSLI